MSVTIAQQTDKPLSSALLIVTIDSADHLPRSPGKDVKPHLKAVITLDKRTHKTKTCNHTSDPVWEEQFVFYVQNLLHKSRPSQLSTAMIGIGSD